MVQRWHGYFIGGFLQELRNPAPIGVESRAKANTPLNPLSPAHDGGTQKGLSCFSGLEWKAGGEVVITVTAGLQKILFPVFNLTYTFLSENENTEPTPSVLITSMV